MGQRLTTVDQRVARPGRNDTPGPPLSLTVIGARHFLASRQENESAVVGGSATIPELEL